MPTYCKIPAKLKGEGIAAGAYVIWCKFKELGTVGNALHAVDLRDGIPAMGKIMVKGKYYYYCRYGMLSDPDFLYAKPVKRKKKRLKR